ncbi:MAG: asparagine synthase-related protein [Lachnospiraceae bacterium]|nr:asparagine synthase-related protein [Lachnospiraceae bacterium]
MYPLGFCGENRYNDFNSQPTGKIKSVIPYAEHLAKLGANAIYFGPVFESTKHGYDTADYVKTEFQYINQATPAAYIVIDSLNAMNIKTYWKLGRKKIKLKNKQEYYKAHRDIITDSVRRRLAVFPDKIGAELSGGLDSGVIDILINRLGREGCYYSWSFSPEDLPLVPDDERQVIADICNQEGITCLYGAESMNLGPNSNVGKSHTQLGLSVDLAKDAELNYALPPYINTLIICETAELMKNNGCKVVFSGHGGDEGVSHRSDPFEMFHYREYVHFFQHFWSLHIGEKRHLIRTFRRCIKTVKTGVNYMKRPFQEIWQAPELVGKALNDKFKALHIPPLYFAFDPIKYIYSGNTHVRPDVAGLLGAYSGARYIFPYLDYRVADFAVSIPRYLYIESERRRVIFREAFKDIMPKSLYEVTAKDNPSTANQEHKPDPEWVPKFRKHKDWLMGQLNRDYWEKYLDYDVIDNWDVPDEIAQEDKAIHIYRASKLKICLQFQNMIEIVRRL